MFASWTLSGAPKIRAMQIIDDIEAENRGPYGGAICAINAAGDLDSYIIIRTAVVKDNHAYVTAGAGIVQDSIAINEANETRHKANSVLNAIHFSQEEK